MGGYLPGGFTGGRSVASDSGRTDRRDSYDRGRENERRYPAPVSSSSADRRIDSYTSSYSSSRYDTAYRPPSTGSRAYEAYESERRNYPIEPSRTQRYGDSYSNSSRSYDNVRDSGYRAQNYDVPGNYRLERSPDRYISGGSGNHSSDYVRPRSRSRSRERVQVPSRGYADHKSSPYLYRHEFDDRDTFKNVSTLPYSGGSRSVGLNRDDYSQSRFSRPANPYPEYPDDRSRTR